MFLEYYRLLEQPFGVTPDPRFLYMSETHREALASLFYGVKSGRGFTALVAKPGMGKTSLLFRLMQNLEPAARTVFLFQTQCDSREFLKYLLTDMGIQTDSSDLVKMHSQLNETLAENARTGRQLVIIVDEAQNLDPSVLETIRLLSDFETSRQKLIQIILAGQLQLADKLASPSLVQLSQRISMLSRLKPFSREETAAYIRHRLTVAGHSGAPLFSDGAVDLIAELSEGIPRNINNLCFNALSLGYATKQPEISAPLIKEAAADLSIFYRPETAAPLAAPISAPASVEHSPPMNPLEPVKVAPPVKVAAPIAPVKVAPPAAPAPAAPVIAPIAAKAESVTEAAASAKHHPDAKDRAQFDSDAQPPARSTTAPETRKFPTVTPVSITSGSPLGVQWNPSTSPPTSHAVRNVVLAACVVVAAFLAGYGWQNYHRADGTRSGELRAETMPSSPAAAPGAATAATNHVASGSPAQSENPPVSAPMAGDKASNSEGGAGNSSASSAPAMPFPAPSSASSSAPGAPGAPGISAPAPAALPPNVQSVLVKPNDTLWGLSQKYSPPSATADNFHSITSLNNLADPNHIEAGQRLLLPVQPAKGATATAAGALPASKPD